MRAFHWIWPFFNHPRQYAKKLILDPHYREYMWLCSRYGGEKRGVERSISTKNGTFLVKDVDAFISTYREIFLEENYDFPWAKSSPLIFDIGANVGVSIAFFKKKFPKCKIVAVEADPEVFELLVKNIAINKWSGVEVIQAAVWKKNGKIKFSPDGGVAGKIDSGHGSISVPTIALRGLIGKKRFSFLKMDIEGAENDLVPDLRAVLSKGPYVYIEYHSSRKNPQFLGEILKVLKDKKFRVQIQSLFSAPRPYWSIKDNSFGFDLQLSIFATKGK
jgi:FkbM family methyltransferase